MKKYLSLTIAAMLSSSVAQAQLSTNPDKFLGNITTRYSMDYNGFSYYKYWNQVTCENESKWGSVEGTNGSFNWPSTQINYAKQHNFPFKWHAIIWGAQHPGWFNSSMSAEQRYKEIVQWMDALQKQYPNLELIDVANECVGTHQADTQLFREALGGNGATGWDWLIKAFEMAYERWPNAILIYNDFNTFRWDTQAFISLCKTLRDAGAPLDAYGNQAHELTDCSLSEFKNGMNTLQSSLKMPCYITEYDIATSDDDYQKQRYSEQIPVMWEADYCAGVTLWGWHYGCTWTTDGNSGLIMPDKTERPALKWLREYMATDKAKNAKSPFPGMKKEASVYIKPQAANIEKEKTSTITVRAKMRTKTIEKVELYVANALLATMTDGGDNGEYVAEYTPTATGTKELKAVVTCTDGFTWTRYGSVNVADPRSPFKPTLPELPGKVEFEDFDKGADGIAFHDQNSQRQDNTGANYRTDTGIDIGKAGTNYEVGYTEAGEWMEYTIDVKEEGLYAYDIYYSAPEAGATFNIALSENGQLTYLTDEKETLPSTGSWSTYKTASKRMTLPLSAGEQCIRFTIVGGASQYIVNLDYMKFSRVDINEDMKVALASDLKETSVGTKTTITANVEGDAEVKNIKFFVDGALKKTVTEAPYEYAYTPYTKGSVNFTAVATDVDGKESNIAELYMKVWAKRTPYKTGANKVPGTIEAENFDKGEEGLSYHDTDAEVHDNAGYRTDSEGVDIVAGNNGYAIGWTASGEWLEYTIEVINDGYYTLDMVYSNGSSSSASVNFKLRDEDNKLATLWTATCAGTGGWSNYKTKKITTKKMFEAGKYIVRVTFTNGNINLDNFTFNCVEDLTSIDSVIANDTTRQATGTFNLSGQRVNEHFKGIVIKNGKKFLKK